MPAVLQKATEKMFLQNVAFFSPRRLLGDSVVCSAHLPTDQWLSCTAYHAVGCSPNCLENAFLMFLSHSTVYFSNITEQLSINSFSLLFFLFATWVPLTIFSTRDLSIYFAFLHLHSFSQEVSTLLHPFSSKPLIHAS